MIFDLKLFRFTLKINGPLKEKKGILLYGKTKNGREAWSEVSPLPGFNVETLLEAERELLEIREQINGFAPLKKKLLPSVAFGLNSLTHLLNDPNYIPFKSYPICGFLSGDFNEMQKQIPLLLQSGYTHIKVKIALLSFTEAHTIIQKLLGKVRLRIDVNRKWSLEESLLFFSNYRKNAFEYIEEPVPTFEDLLYFPYPTALDETLREEHKLISIPQIKALILKPMMSGDNSSIQKTIDFASQLKAKIILSSSHESGVGLFHLCALMDRLSLQMHPLGIDPYRLIEEDLLVNRHSINRGMITLSPLILKQDHLCLIN